MASPSTKQGRRPLANPKAAIDDWLNLIDPDGAFLTVTELTAAFPHGFEPMPAEQRTELRARAADLEDDPAGRSELRRWLLATVLDWDDLLAEDQRLPAASLVRVAEQGVSIRPSQALLDVENPNKIRVGIFLWPLGTRLERRTDITTAGDTWPASPIQRAETWCRESGVPLALVTDDDQWTLVWAPRGAPAASCRWRLSDLADERILQAGFVSLLAARRFFAVGDDETLEKLFERAADAEAEITKGLGSSVRRSVELLVAAISRDDVANDHRVLARVAPTEVYESAVTVLMRLVFLLFAEERRLLPAEDPLWAESYSVLTLRDELRAASVRDGEDALERRSTAWHRLLATCRAVHGGANHDRLTLPAYGGRLFDPDRFPFLEGRRGPDHVVAGGIALGPAEDAATGPGRPVAIDDRTVLAILDALLNIKVRSGRSTVTQRVSYKALDVEQIGHCYEGLLDHSSVRIDALSVGLTGPEGAEPEIAIDDLEHHLAGGIDGLCEWLADKERCNKTASALAKELEKRPSGVDLARLRVACGHNDENVARVQRFWGLIRTDLRGLPVVLLPGSQFVTRTSTRRNMGAQYTTKALAEEVARYAIEPLVYEPGPQNEVEPEKWKLRPPAGILGLRVCDPAIGSGAILTAAGRYLADRLIEAVVEHGSGEGPFATRLSALANANPEEQVVLARREIVDHCLYGVDKNPVAAEMAKLSLWLTTMARERPFTFLDHAIQVGDSLLGITDIEQLRWLHLNPVERQGIRGFESLTIDLRLREAVELARKMQELSVVTVRDAALKQRLNGELRGKLADLSVVADVIVGATLSAAGRSDPKLEELLDPQIDRIHTVLDGQRPIIERDADTSVLHSVSDGWLQTDLLDESRERRCLHWPLQFPEVFLEEGRDGFDAVVGNPPFLGGGKVAATLGIRYEAFLKSTWSYAVGFVDLVAYFFIRADRITGHSGSYSLIGPEYLRRDANRDAVLLPLIDLGRTIYRATSTRPWPGEAKVHICLVSATKSSWFGLTTLDGNHVAKIGPSLGSIGERLRGSDAYQLKEVLKQTEGVNVYGASFFRSKEEWDATLFRFPSLRPFLRPFISAATLCSSPNQRPDRYVVDFGTRDKGDIPHELLAFVDELEERVADERKAQIRQIHEPRSWLFWDKRERAMAMVRQLDRVLAFPIHSKHLVGSFIDSSCCPSHKLMVFLTDDTAYYALLSSSIFVEWVIETGGSRPKGFSLSARSSVDTLAIPARPTNHMRNSGEQLMVCRSNLERTRTISLTEIINLQHDRDVTDQEIIELRKAQIDVDRAVCEAYGWSDLELNHHHWDTPQGIRFTVSQEARHELLDRLLKLNHERYSAEVAAGLHDKKAKKTPVKRKTLVADSAQHTLL